MDRSGGEVTAAEWRVIVNGEAYFKEGRVTELNEHNGKVNAVVSGTQDYRVRLRIEEDDLSYSCSCPLGEDLEFCKHCVAAALA